MKYTLFQDLDGCLADFDAGCISVTGHHPRHWDSMQGKMWGQLARAWHDEGKGGFYTNLPWMSDGRLLWEFVKPYKPTILSGVPMGKWAAPQKLHWCTRELGHDVPVITCMAREKHTYCLDENCILIDDRAYKARKPWERAGGIFIHHVSAEQTIAQLRELGF